MSGTAERKFANLRRRLDQLGYKQPLGIDSLPLVEKLFSDLIHTTESLRKNKLSAGKTQKESREIDALLEPYKAENARVVRANNELHLDLLKLKEEYDSIIKELKAQVRKLDHDTSDLKFLNNQYVHKVYCLEKDSKTKAERIQQLQEKNMQAVVQTPGGKKHSIPFRRQRMQIAELVPPSNASAYPVLQPDDPYIADLLQIADRRIHELQEEIIKIKLDLEHSNDYATHLKTQVEERGREIDRLNHVLKGGRPHDVISLEARNSSNEKLISHLKLQIEYLQESNQSLEEKASGLQQRRRDSTELTNLALKNQELCEELTHIDNLAKQMEIDKERVLEMADMELLQTKKEIKRQQRVIEDLEDVIARIRKDQSEGESEKHHFQDHVVELKDQNEKMEGLMVFLEEEKIRLQSKVELIMLSEKDLVMELEMMKNKYGVCGRECSPSRLDAFVKSLEEERDRYRLEAELYKRTRRNSRRDQSLSLSLDLGRSSKSKVTRASNTSQTQDVGSNFQGDVSEEELLRVVKERDELRAALLNFERHMEDIQNDVKYVCAERDELKTQLKEAQDDLKTPHSGDASDDALRLQDEIKLAEIRIEQLTIERDALAERLQASHISDRHAEERTISEMEDVVKRLEQERVELQRRVGELQRQVGDLQRQVGEQQRHAGALQRQVRELQRDGDAEGEEPDVQFAAVVENPEESAQQRAETNALRLLQEQMEQSLSETQHRLSVKMDELYNAHQQIEKLEDRIAELSRRESKHDEEVAALQKSIMALDREKDALQEEADLKTEKVVALEEEFARKEKTLEEVKLTVNNLDTSLVQLQEALKSREREISSLRKQLDAGLEETSGFKREKEIALRENRRLQDDLSTMSRENQAIHAEMEEALREKDELKLRVHSYISEVARIEKLMATKEQENKDLLEQFAVAHSEVEKNEQRLLQAEGLSKSIRMELLSSDSERRHLRDTVSHQEREIQQHTQALQAYEAQVSSLVRRMSKLEEALGRAAEEKADLQSDLASVRELCVKLDAGKEFIARHLTAKSMDLERVTGELEDLRSEAELAKKQLASERLTICNLETLLSTNRQKEFQIHLTASEKESELKVLRDKLMLANGRTGEQAREVSDLRGKLSQLQTQLDVLRRQLTTERFERERAVQEIRKQGLSFSSLHSSSERSISRIQDHSTDKSVSFKDVGERDNENL